MRVLISGAGIAGPTLAYFLAKTGVAAHVTIVERAPELLAIGQNIDLSGAAISAVKRMGLLEDLKRLNTTEIGARFVDDGGRPYASFPLPGPSPTQEFEILRGDLANIIYEATRRFDNVEYRFGTTVSRVVSNGDDGVRVVLSHSEKEETYDLLVAADGQWSRIRKACFPEPEIVDKDAYVAYFTIPRQEQDTRWWEIYFGSRSRVAALRPDSHGTSRVMLGMMPLGDAQRRECQTKMRGGADEQKKLLKETFAGLAWQVDRFLKDATAADDFYMHGIQQVRMQTWSANRVVCVGDAAYAPSLFTGNGATLAITGAYCLAGELSKLRDDEHPARALQAYESVFKPHVHKIQHIPSYAPALFFPNSRWHRWLLHKGLATLSRVIAPRGAAAKEYTGPTDSDGREAEADDAGFPLPEYPELAR